jgi:hypothetical protein
LMGRVVGAATYGSCPASTSRYFTNIVSRSSAASPARISTFAMNAIVDGARPARRQDAHVPPARFPILSRASITG